MTVITRRLILAISDLPSVFCLSFCLSSSSTYNRQPSHPVAYGDIRAWPVHVTSMVVTPELLSFFPLLKALPMAARVKLAQQSSVQKYARRAVVLNAGVR
ncbi:MAG TPA: hypothetical protein VGE69_09565, partial [Pseudomonadales bacterium]